MHNRHDGNLVNLKTSDNWWSFSGEAFEENKEEIEQGDEYEFTPWEGRILEVVMESMRMAGLALAVRAMATICLGEHFLHYSCLNYAEAEWLDCCFLHVLPSMFSALSALWSAVILLPHWS